MLSIPGFVSFKKELGFKIKQKNENLKRVKAQAPLWSKLDYLELIVKNKIIILFQS